MYTHTNVVEVGLGNALWPKHSNKSDNITFYKVWNNKKIKKLCYISLSRCLLVYHFYIVSSPGFVNLRQYPIQISFEILPIQTCCFWTRLYFCKYAINQMKQKRSCIFERMESWNHFYLVLLCFDHFLTYYSM